jgi:hypothetical protein
MNTPFLKMSQGDKKRLAVSEIIIIVLAIIGLAVVVWVAWLRPEGKQITSFKTCAAAGYPVHASYPEVCVTPSGKQFIDPAERVQLSPGSGSSNTSKNPSQSSQKLVFMEWGVALPYPQGIAKLSATKADDDTYKISLDDVSGDCKGMNTLRRAGVDGDMDGFAHTPAQVKMSLGNDQVKQIGKYYYMFVQGQASCTSNVKTQQQINALSAGFTGSQIQNLIAD